MSVYLSSHESDLAAYQRGVDLDARRDTAIEVAEANILLGSVSSLIAQSGHPYAGRLTDLVRIIAENIVDEPDDDY
jgi:hypothetical protein